MQYRVLAEKLKEAAASVLPVTAIVAVLCLALVRVDVGLMLSFLLGSGLLILGMGLFTLGAELSMSRIGNLIGAKMTKSRKLWFILAVSFLLGVAITMAEPDLQVLATNVPAIDKTVLIVTVSVGVGLFLMLCMVRILFSVSLRLLLIVPLVLERDQLLAGGEFLKVKIVSQEHRRAAGDIRLHAGFCNDVADIVAEVIHVGQARYAEFQTFRDRQRRRRAHAPAVEPVFAREDIVVEPFLQLQIVCIPAQQLHRKMRVAVDQSRHQDHTGRVDDLRGLFLRGVLAEIADFAVGHADKGVGPDRHPLVHRDDADMGKEGIHSHSSSMGAGGCCASRCRISKISSFCCKMVSMRAM